MTGQGRPLRFLAVALGLWVGGRVLVVAPWRGVEEPSLARAARVEAAPPPAMRTPSIGERLSPLMLRAPPSSSVPRRRPGSSRKVPEVSAAFERAVVTGPRPSPGNEGAEAGTVPPLLAAREAAAPVPPLPAPSTPLQPRLAPALASASRLSASAWLFLRRGGGGLLAPGGQLGGSQVGARLVWRLDEAGRFGLAARVSGPLRQPGFEAAAGIEWRPWPGAPLRFAAERRFALDRFGRDAFSLYGAGGADDVALGRGVRLDAYGQAGVVGARARDLFADGAIRVGEQLPVSAGANLTLGAGLWGAAQPDVARIDLGPQAVLRWSVAGTGLALALDWRLRAAGRAHPGSGPTLTLGVDF